MVATIVACSFVTDILANRVPVLRRLVYSAPVEVVRQLRLQGVEDEADVAHRTRRSDVRYP